MIRLAIIFLLISIIEIKSCSFSINEVTELKRLFNESERDMELATRNQNENAAILLGNARCGKSTLINYLMGNELKAYKKNDEIKIRKANENSPGPEIGAGSVSVTTIPTKWNSTRTELENLDIWDTAGFVDNRNEMQDINNAFHLYHLTKKVDSLKLILVISYGEITSGNVNQILSLLKTLEGYFNNRLKDIFPSISVIISKAPDQINNNYPVDSEFLNYKLNTNLLSSSQLDISEVSKDFVRHLINNNQRVAFFRKVKKLGKVTSAIDDNIISAIKNCDSIRKPFHQDIGFTFSVNSKNCLQKTNDDLLNMNDFLNLISLMNNRYNETYNYLKKSLDREVLLQKMSSFEDIYRHIDISSLDNSDANSKIKILKESDNTMKDFIVEKNLENKISLTEFIDSIIPSGKIRRINILLEAIVKLLYDRTSVLISICKLNVNNITAGEFDKKSEETLQSQNATINILKEKMEKEKIPKQEEGTWNRVFRTIGTERPRGFRIGPGR
ncbi:uncharacterized protein LOC122506895 [Leptopilina heterotoma]|uniref:uncharacterized protein LOC122506895 n=1 Tax=Leptopilina heterotoma TaxID=63436 RepID=UPI001CA96B67|nr:uncharacterized protein LOC122506895 [Leptopilina heterotoma]